MTIHRIFTLALALLTASACSFNPNDIGAGNYTCNGNEDCTPGYVCNDDTGYCIANATENVENVGSGESGESGSEETPDEPRCGNDQLDDGEDCDDGNEETELCDYGQSECIVCDDTCQSTQGATSFCGDDMVDEDNGEVCDDGETTGTGETPCINYCKERHPWPIDPCHASTFPTTDANELNAVAFNFDIQDQNGIEIKLHDFCDRVVVLTSVAAWSDTDGVLANQLGELYSGLKDQGLMVVTFMGESNQGNEPSASDLTDWVETHNLQHPVAADPGFAVAEMFGASNSNGSLGLPFNVVIRRGMIIDGIDTNPTEEMLRDLTNQ